MLVGVSVAVLYKGAKKGLLDKGRATCVCGGRAFTEGMAKAVVEHEGGQCGWTECAKGREGAGEVGR